MVRDYRTAAGGPRRACNRGETEGSAGLLALDRFFGPPAKVVSVHIFAALRRVVFDD